MVVINIFIIPIKIVFITKQEVSSSVSIFVIYFIFIIIPFIIRISVIIIIKCLLINFYYSFLFPISSRFFCQLSSCSIMA